MSVVPVSLSYLIREATKADYGEVCVLGGRELELVRFMGQVVPGSMETEGCTTLYLVADALSGAVVPVLQYARSAAVEGEVEDELFMIKDVLPEEVLAPSVYYTFHGVPRILSTARGTPPTHVHIDLQSARRVTDMNELTFHGLDCIYSHIRAK